MALDPSLDPNLNPDVNHNANLALWAKSIADQQNNQAYSGVVQRSFEQPTSWQRWMRAGFPPLPGTAGPTPPPAQPPQPPWQGRDDDDDDDRNRSRYNRHRNRPDFHGLARQAIQDRNWEPFRSAIQSYTQGIRDDHQQRIQSRMGALQSRVQQRLPDFRINR